MTFKFISVLALASILLSRADRFAIFVEGIMRNISVKLY